MGENRDAVGRFRPGHAGGPGRPRGQSISAELRRQADPEAIARFLLDLVNDTTASTKDRLQAAGLVLDRLEGRPTTRVEVTAGTSELPPNWDQLPRAEREAALDRLLGEAKP